jgi:hypothetical protein
MSHTKTFKITPTCFDHQMIIIREPSDPGQNDWLKFESSSVVMRQHTVIRFACCIMYLLRVNSVEILLMMDSRLVRKM